MRKGKIYGLVCPFTNKVRYVGQTIRPLKERLYHHISQSMIDKFTYTHKERWIRKIINDKKIVDIKELESCNIRKLDNKEIYWMQYYKNNNLTNTAPGGRSNVYKISKNTSGKKRKPHSDETKEKIRQTKLGSKNPNFGKKCVVSQEIKNKISRILRNSKKLKQSRRNKEYRKLISDIQSNPTFLLSEKLEVIKEFKNCREISDFFKLTYANIKAARRNKRKIGKQLQQKYYVVYKKDYENFKLTKLS